jgi:2-hydroxymuconate-semialdehyde hydrolase
MGTNNPEIGGSITAAGIATNLHDRGAGYPVLLMHGSGPGRQRLGQLAAGDARLARARRVIAPDLVGFGFTERPADVSYDMDTWVAQAVGVLDALGIEQADLVGNSFGGALALALAIRHPQRVRRLVLMGSVGVPFDHAGARRGVGLHAVVREHAWPAGPVRPRPQPGDRRTGRAALSKPASGPASRSPSPPCSRRRASAGSMRCRQREADIRALPHETLIIHGRDDKVIPLSTSLTLAQLDRTLASCTCSAVAATGRRSNTRRALPNRLVGDFLAEADAAN